MTHNRPWSSALLLAVGVLFAADSTAQQAAPAQPAAKGAPAPKAAKPAQKAKAPAPQIVLEPRAIEILKAASAKLAAAKSMAFTAVVSYESPSSLGPPLVYATKSEVTLQRPDKLKIISPGDGLPSEFYYDGKVMMAFAPTENLAGTSAMGGVYAALPAGAISINKGGTTYYLSGNTFFQPSFGANSVYYRVVPAP